MSCFYPLFENHFQDFTCFFLINANFFQGKDLQSKQKMTHPPPAYVREILCMTYLTYAHFFGVFYGKLAGFGSQISQFHAIFFTPDASNSPIFGLYLDYMNIQGDKYGFWKISNFRPVSAILKSNLDQNSKKGQNLAFKQRKRAYMWKFSKPIVPGPLDIHKVLLQAKNLTFSDIWDEENRTKLRSYGSEKGQFSI